MAVDILALVLILLITGYYATQGLFSTAISLVAAIFASVLAMALYEPFSAVIASWKPAPARGVTFLLLFFLVLSGLRLGSDFIVPKGIRLTNRLADSIGGGLLGFFAALVIIGSCIIGFEMLPVHTSILNVAGMGFDRYGDKGMTGQGGVADAPANVWLAPDRFTQAIWNGVSGRSLGGANSFDSVHPDITVESYGYRNVVEYGANSIVPPNLLSIDAAYYTDAPDQLQKLHVSPDKEGAVVRIVVDRGTDQPKISADADGNFRITASEIRLVTDKGNQYYPIGHLVNGITFEAMPLDTGHLVDDYQSNKVVEDWVFQINRDEKPHWIEVKQLARKDLTDMLSNKPAAPAALASYPKRPYRFNHATLDIQVVAPNGAGIKDARVFITTSGTKFRNVKSVVQDAYDNCMAALNSINEGNSVWAKAAGKGGVPSDSDFKAQMSMTRNQITSKGPDEEVQWSDVISVIMYGACKPDGAQNATALPLVFDSKVVPLLTDVRAEGKTDAQGKVSFPDVAPGKYKLIVSGGTVDVYAVWVTDAELKPKQDANMKLKVGSQTVISIIAKP
jgi:hypothetical protein